MKKLFTLLLLLIATATSALAQDLYLRGGIEDPNWNTFSDANKFTNNGNDTFTLYYVGTLKGTFKLADQSWNIFNYGGGADIIVNTEHQLYWDGGNSNLKDAIVNPTLEFDKKNLKLFLRKYTWKLHMQTHETKKDEQGKEIKDENGKVSYVWKDFDMTEEPDGTWSFNNNNAVFKYCEFGLKRFADENKQDEYTWFAANNGAGVINVNATDKLTKSEACPVTATNTSNFILNHDGAAKLVFNPKTMELYLENWQPTGVADIADENAVPVYYNMQGVKMGANALVPGIYIVKQGKTTKKVVVK